MISWDRNKPRRKSGIARSGVSATSSSSSSSSSGGGGSVLSDLILIRMLGSRMGDEVS